MGLNLRIKPKRRIKRDKPGALNVPIAINQVWLMFFMHGLKTQNPTMQLRIVGLIKQSWLESGGVYAYRKVHSDLKDMGERCIRHRFARLMKQEGIKAQVG